MKRSIYISRKVLNYSDIRTWAREQGFASCLVADDLHVTVAFDKRKHDWRELPLKAIPQIDIHHFAERNISEFRKNIIVMEIYNESLTTRWEELRQAGLYWKWSNYRPHITITHNGADISKISPYDGVIYLGPEIITEVVDRWKIIEEDFS